MKTSYQTIPGFESLILEDSHVMNVQERKEKLVIKIEAALTPGHQYYKTPKVGEAFCYMDMEIVFANVISLTWVFCKMLKIPSNIDKEGDYGNVDFLVKEDKQFCIGGEWGEIVVVSDVPKLLPSE